MSDDRLRFIMGIPIPKWWCRPSEHRPSVTALTEEIELTTLSTNHTASNHAGTRGCRHEWRLYSFAAKPQQLFHKGIVNATLFVDMDFFAQIFTLSVLPDHPMGGMISSKYESYFNSATEYQNETSSNGHQGDMPRRSSTLTICPLSITCQKSRERRHYVCYLFKWYSARVYV